MAKTPAKWLKAKAKYNRIPEVQHRRVLQNKARRLAIREGRAHVGDGTNVDHIKPLDQGGSGSRKNTRVVSEKFNKGWRKRQPGMYGRD